LHYHAGLFATLLTGQGNPDFDTGLGASSGLYRMDDLDPKPWTDIAGDSGFYLEQNLDRMNWTQYFPVADVSIGRQTINLGTARFISPTDVFRPNNIDHLVSDYAPGIDAIRAQFPVGDLSTLDIGHIMGASRSQGASFAKLKSSVIATDLSFTGIRLFEKQILSAGVESSVGQFGLWQELALLTSNNQQDVRWSFGFDATIVNYLAQVELHTNQPGDSTAANYLTNAAEDPFYQQGIIGFFGQHYVAGSFAWLDGIRSAHDVTMIVNLDDYSSLTILSYSFSLSDNWDLEGTMNLPIGDAPEMVNDELVPGSEFGAYPLVLMLKIEGNI